MLFQYSAWITQEKPMQFITASGFQNIGFSLSETTAHFPELSVHAVPSPNTCCTQKLLEKKPDHTRRSRKRNRTGKAGSDCRLRQPGQMAGSSGRLRTACCAGTQIRVCGLISVIAIMPYWHEGRYRTNLRIAVGNQDGEGRNIPIDNGRVSIETGRMLQSVLR